MKRLLLILILMVPLAGVVTADVSAKPAPPDTTIGVPTQVCGTCEGGSRPCYDWQAGWLNTATHEHCELTYRGPTWYEWVYRPDLHFTVSVAPPQHTNGVCCGGGDYYSYGDPCNWWDAYWNTQFQSWQGPLLVCRYTGQGVSGYTLVF